MSLPPSSAPPENSARAIPHRRRAPAGVVRRMGQIESRSSSSGRRAARPGADRILHRCDDPARTWNPRLPPTRANRRDSRTRSSFRCISADSPATSSSSIVPAPPAPGTPAAERRREIRTQRPRSGFATEQLRLNPEWGDAAAVQDQKGMRRPGAQFVQAPRRQFLAAAAFADR